MAEKIEISLTDFVGFVNKMGTAKQNHVKTIKERPEYEPYMDFYKAIRTAIINLHKKKQSKDILDKVLEDLTDEKKKKCYPEIVAGYKKFLGRKQFEWIKPPKKDWKIGNIVITINPEIGLEEKKKDGNDNADNHFYSSSADNTFIAFQHDDSGKGDDDEADCEDISKVSPPLSGVVVQTCHCSDEWPAGD